MNRFLCKKYFLILVVFLIFISGITWKIDILKFATIKTRLSLFYLVYELKNKQKYSNTVDIKISSDHYISLNVIGYNTNLNFLKELGTITELRLLLNAELTDLSFLQDSKIKSLYLGDGLKLLSLEGIQNSNLSELWIKDASRLTDLSPLKKSHLSFLALHNGKDLSLKPIGEIKELEYLDLSQNQISELKFSSEKVNLKFLDISNTQISSLEQLSEFTCLQKIIIKNTPAEKLPIPLSIRHLTDKNIHINYECK